MPRPKKDGKMLNIKIQSDIYNTLEKYCDDKGQTKTIAIERILKEKFEKEGYLEKTTDIYSLSIYKE